MDLDFLEDEGFDLEADDLALALLDLLKDLLLEERVGLGSSLRKVVVTLMKEEPMGMPGPWVLLTPATTFFLSTERVFLAEILGEDLLDSASVIVGKTWFL